MKSNLITSEQADSIIAVIKQFIVSVAQAASEAISEIEESKAPKQHTHVSAGTASILSTGWKKDSNAKFPYYYDLSISGIAAADRVDLNVTIESMDIAIECGLCPTSEAFSGKVRIRAKKSPTAAISAEYWIMKK